MSRVEKICGASAIGMLSLLISSSVYQKVDKPLSEVNPLLAKYDTDHNNCLDSKEAMNLLIDLDTNKDGYLSEEEFSKTKDLFKNDGTLFKWFPLFLKGNVMSSKTAFWYAYSDMMKTQKGDFENWLKLRQGMNKQ